MKDGFEKHYIAKPFGLPLFSKKQFRDHVSTIKYLIEPDPFKLKEDLDHKAMSTTVGYINHVIIKLLHRSKVKRFMDKLGATIVWAVGGSQEVEKHGMTIEQIDDRLLFPTNNYSQKNTICDKWVESMGALTLKIGRREIEHLKYQVNYYTEHFLALKQNNPRQFLIYEVPRILFCIALQELIRTSPYCYLLD
jgi:hypothetical protein